MNQDKKPIFTSSIFDFENVDDNNRKSIENYSRIINSGDHRSRVVLAGMILESYLDRILKCFFIDYKNLSERSDYTFSFKTSLLKSMRIIPNEIIVTCDLIRKVRNEFAHNFEIDKIDQIEPKLVKNINQLFREKTKSKTEIELIEKFHSLYSLGYSELRTYEKNIKLLRETIDDENFEKNLQILNENRLHTFHENLKKEKPLKIIDRGNGEIEEVYPQGLSVIKNKNKNFR